MEETRNDVYNYIFTQLVIEFINICKLIIEESNDSNNKKNNKPKSYWNVILPIIVGVCSLVVLGLTYSISVPEIAKNEDSTRIILSKVSPYDYNNDDYSMTIAY